MKKQKKFYLIYQITNNLNNKIYIGKHTTDCLDDDYFGSGQYLRNAQKKYGLENFTKTILFYCANEEEMNLLEKSVVTPEFCAREDVYNINTGGDGNWDYVNFSSDYAISTKNRQIACRNAGQISMQQCKLEHGKDSTPFTVFLNQLSDNERKQFSDQMSNSLKKTIQTKGFWWVGKHHSDATKQKMRHPHPSCKGTNNAMFGKMWICNDEMHESKTIMKTDPIPDGWRKGRFCK